MDTRVVSNTGQVTSTLSCTNSYPVLDTILYAFEGAFLGGSAMLCYATKDVPDAINEAKVIAIGETRSHYDERGVLNALTTSYTLTE